MLERKPGALAGLKPLARWRTKGLWPASYDRLLDELIERHGKPSGTRQMIQVLALVRSYGHARLHTAIEQAVARGCADAAAIRHLITAADLARARSEIIQVGALSRFERPLPVMTDYDGLLSQGGVMSGYVAALEEATIKQRQYLVGRREHDRRPAAGLVAAVSDASRSPEIFPICPPLSCTIKDVINLCGEEEFGRAPLWPSAPVGTAKPKARRGQGRGLAGWCWSS